MRFGLFALALAGAVLMAGLAGPTPASAFDRGFDGPFREPIADYPLRRAERGCYTRHFMCPDPYAYRYRPRRYYPYYDSGYWRPRREVSKYRVWYRMPPYAEAYGYPVYDRYHPSHLYGRRYHDRHYRGHPRDARWGPYK